MIIREMIRNISPVHLFVAFGIGASLLTCDLGTGPFFKGCWASEEKLESYFDRPDITSILPREHPDLGSDWSKVKRAHLEAIAQLLELYPEEEIYFLARDSELLYDLARWIARDDPKLSSRIHLLNVSSVNAGAIGLKEYLAQEGINEAGLKAGKKILLVDTGYQGTISKAIERQLPNAVRQQIRTHLLISNRPEYPSSRVFLTALNAAAPSAHPPSMYRLIQAYENLPHYTSRSDRFQQLNGSWHPLSPIGDQSDGTASPERALLYREDLIHDAQRDSSRMLLEERRSLWRRLRKLAQGQPPEKLQEELRSLLALHPDDFYVEAIVRDFTEAAQKGHLPLDPKRVWTVESLGLPKAVPWDPTGSNKALIQKKIPRWKPVLDSPRQGIPTLLRTQSFEVLEAMTSVVQDRNFSEALTQALGSEPVTPGTLNFMKTLISSKDPTYLALLPLNTFSKSDTVALKEIIGLFIENADGVGMMNLIREVFSKPGGAKIPEHLRTVIERADSWMLSILADRVLTQPHWQAPEFAPFRDAAKIADPAARKRFLDQKLGPAPSRRCPELVDKLRSL